LPVLITLLSDLSKSISMYITLFYSFKAYFAFAFFELDVVTSSTSPVPS
jgi:hypothetical protein